MNLISLVVLLVGAVTRPTSARCPPRWHLNGVRPDGGYACRQPYPGELQVRGRIVCAAGTVPVMLDHARAGCRARTNLPRFYGNG